MKACNNSTDYQQLYDTFENRRKWDRKAMKRNSMIHGVS